MTTETAKHAGRWVYGDIPNGEGSFGYIACSCGWESDDMYDTDSAEQFAKHAGHRMREAPEPEPRDQTLDPVEAHQQASRVIKRIRSIRKDRAILEASYREQIAEITLWWQQEREKLDGSLTHAELELRPLVALLTHDEKRKSISTPAGVAGFRAGRQSVKVDDADECMAWLAENAPELVREKTTREPDLRAMHARMVDGERFPGVSLSEGTEAFYVDVAGEQP